MRFLITGGAGFIGSALANRLNSDGHVVIVLDDLTKGDARRLRSQIRLVRGNINDQPLLWSLLQEVDCVYHLAARVSVPESLLYPRDYNLTNVGGTVTLMEAMRDTGVKRVVFTSSGAVYGAQARQPVVELDWPLPDSPYAVSKLSAESYLHTIGRLWNIETVALRIFNTYGPNQPLPVSHAPVIPLFLQQLLTGGSIVIFGDGTQTRDYVYISDVVDALVAAATAEGANRQIFNIGSGIETSLNQLVTTLAQVTAKTPHILYNQTKFAGVPRLYAEIGRSQQILGYRPQYSLEEGIRQFLRHDSRWR